MDPNRIRQEVWTQLKNVAVPDSRFHFNFAEFIPDFKDNEYAVYEISKQKQYKKAEVIFVAPDNCLQLLREEALLYGKKLIVPSYGIRRGFFLLDPKQIDPEEFLLASTLDGMEILGKRISLNEMPNIEIMFTGCSAVSRKNGIRFGKGHGFFDIEWGVLYTLGTVSTNTPVWVVCHECQLIDIQLEPSETDSASDKIFTNENTYEIADPQKPTCGILWDKLKPQMKENISILNELESIEKG